MYGPPLPRILRPAALPLPGSGTEGRPLLISCQGGSRHVECAGGKPARREDPSPAALAPLSFAPRRPAWIAGLCRAAKVPGANPPEYAASPRKGLPMPFSSRDGAGVIPEGYAATCSNARRLSARRNQNGQIPPQPKEPHGPILDGVEPYRVSPEVQAPEQGGGKTRGRAPRRRQPRQGFFRAGISRVLRHGASCEGGIPSGDRTSFLTAGWRLREDRRGRPNAHFQPAAAGPGSTVRDGRAEAPFFYPFSRLKKAHFPEPKHFRKQQ